MTITLLFCIGCGEDAPLDPIEDESATANLSGDAPEVEKQTTVLQVVSHSFTFYDKLAAAAGEENLLVLPSEDVHLITPIRTPTEVYIVLQGRLTKRTQIFQKEMYHLLWCYLDDEIVLVNVLDNQIPYISEEEDWEQIGERKEEGDKLRAEINAE